MDDLRRRLAALAVVHPPVPPGTKRASVALLVRPQPAGPELLLIKRTESPNDPWSGHIALPGGRWEPEDPDDLTTAIRETFEEVQIDLRALGSPLGALPETRPRAGTPFVVRPFVFGVPASTPAYLSAEVAVAMWAPVADLRADGSAGEYLHTMPGGEHLRFPAIHFRGHTIWGLTHRILHQLFALLPPPGYRAGARR